MKTGEVVERRKREEKVILALDQSFCFIPRELPDCIIECMASPCMKIAGSGR